MRTQIIFYILFYFCMSTSLISQSGKAKSLEIGDVWIYNDYSEFDYEGHYKKEEVIRDTIINNKLFAIIYHSDSNNKYLSYERADSSKIFAYRFYDSTEYVVVDFNQRDTSLGNTQITVDTVFTWGSSRIRVCSHSFGSISDGYYCLTEGIGFTYSSNEGHGEDYYTKLVAGCLNGVKYGDTTLVGINQNIRINSYELCQNFPNPFNPRTKINFSIPERGFVTLDVFNSIGQKVATLISEEKDAGKFNVNFIADNLSSGIYFYKISVNNFIQIKKMILLR